MRRVAAACLAGAAVALAAWGLAGWPAPARAADSTLATAPEGEPICVTCHTNVSPEVVATWRTQNHGRAQVGCPTCHNSHDRDFRPEPLAEVCYGCHDVDRIHPDFTEQTPASRCMDCHTGNVHLLAGPDSWFFGGLPPTKLEGEQPGESQVAASTGRAAGILVVALAVVFGTLIGLVLDRFVRNL
ncbi:MAG: hypothetical protein M5U22_15050 [Thermoleophilia bacterium]|nr:hypothetical protein [Thermoleophilia bacterium]